MANPYPRLKPGTNVTMSVSERILSRCVRDDSGCLVWQGATTGPTNGSFGLLKIGARHYRTHRIIFEAHVRPLQDKEDIGHTCRNNRCCEPTHLFAFSRNFASAEKESE